MLSVTELITVAHELRIVILKMITEAKSGHPGGSLSCIDILTALWFREMRGVESPKNLAPNRDRFVLSKGHGVPALYAVLAKKGFIPVEELSTLRKKGSRLQGHPDRVRLPILEASTGSLGQGLSVAQGIALGMKLDQSPARIFCVLGDGEIQEGQIWEAAMSAPKFELSNFCVIIDNNQGQIDGPVSKVMPIEPVVDKWKAFGWKVFDIPGHDMETILQTFAEARKLQESGGKQPVVIVARTIKGKGVSFMEGVIDWHGVAPKKDETERAISEIESLLKAGGSRG